LIRAWSVPPDGVAVPIASDTKAQHVLVQLTRLPTTVDQTNWTGADDERPEAVRPTAVFTRPLLSASVAFTLLLAARPLARSVVRALRVGATSTGQSMEDGGGPLSPVTVNVTVAPFV